MRWLIDGYNVIRRDADLRAHEAESLEAGRTALLRLVTRAARATGDRFTVVFDGAPGSGPGPASGQVAVTFSRPPETADDVLVRQARQLGAGAALVTSDRAVRDAAGRAGCAVISADEFLRALSAESEPERDDDDDDQRNRPDKRGNPRRLSKEARAAQRALRRLRLP
ncbi:MAG: NYN domain-containing protein [Candidatus Rokubacteria bacterium]|nr:NYN domain-containing protein [Candidatus Rokubacteria bacterium]